MPEDLSRRRFFQQASVGVAAAGALAVGGAGILAAERVHASSGPLLDGSGVIAHVVDAKKGVISILVGTREIIYTNRDMAQELLRATR